MNVPILILFIVLYSTKDIICSGKQPLPEAFGQSQHISTEGEKIKNIDGVYINANSMECFRKFRQWLLDAVKGKSNSADEITGMYTYDDAPHTIASLAHLEYELYGQEGDNVQSREKELYILLEKIKEDLITKAQILISSSGTAKDILYTLIRQECEKLNITDGLLSQWASSPRDEQISLIKNNIPTFASLLQFSIDLLQFLTNVIHNCPIANKQLELRIEKWKKINELLPDVLKSCKLEVEDIDTIAFLRYIKVHDLDLLTISEITKEQLMVILYAYQKRANEHRKTD